VEKRENRTVPFSFVAAALLLFSYGEKAQAVFGVADRMPAATLIVPMFEVAINTANDSTNTLPVITNTSAGTVVVHWQVWDANGNSTDIFGNTSVGSLETIPFDMGGLINAASAATKTQLADTDGLQRVYDL